MNNSRLSLTRPLGRVSAVAAVFFLIVAVIGFADATYLTIEHYRGAIPPCTTDGCEQVLTSAYATVSGVPVALIGAVYYLLMAIAAFMYLESRRGGVAPQFQAAVFRWALLATTLGFLGSLYFLSLQAFVIGAYCQYCLVSAATSTVLFLIACRILTRRSNVELPNTDDQA